MREREREREGVCEREIVCVREGEREMVCVCVKRCVRERVVACARAQERWRWWVLTAAGRTLVGARKLNFF